MCRSLLPTDPPAYFTYMQQLGLRSHELSPSAHPCVQEIEMVPVPSVGPSAETAIPQGQDTGEPPPPPYAELCHERGWHTAALDLWRPPDSPFTNMTQTVCVSFPVVNPGGASRLPTLRTPADTGKFVSDYGARL